MPPTLLLVNHLADLQNCSRSKAKGLLDQRRVFINGKRCWMAKCPVRPNDHIEVADPCPVPNIDNVSILYQDSAMLIVDKPPGWLADGVKGIGPAIAQRVQFPEALPAHRLDVETSGCLALATTASMQEALFALFRERKVQKSYIALVYGAFPPNPLVCRKKIDGKNAETSLRLLKSGKNISLIEAKPITGRTHQIRKHLHRLGFPVVGDKHYAPETAIPAPYRSATRQQLHARELSFPHPVSGTTIRVQAARPCDFKIWEQTIKND